MESLTINHSCFFNGICGQAHKAPSLSVLMAQCGPSFMFMLMLKGWLIVRKALLQ